MVKDDGKIEIDGEILQELWFGDYSLKLDGMDMQIKASPSGKMKQNKIRLLPGDKVKVELNPINPGVGRITYRYSPQGKWPIWWFPSSKPTSFGK